MGELTGKDRHHGWMSDTAITVQGVIDTFLVLLIGVGPKLALVPFVEITSSLDAATKRRVQRRMMGTAATVALILMVLGELLRALLHFSVGVLVDRGRRDPVRPGGADGARAA